MTEVRSTVDVRFKISTPIHEDAVYVMKLRATCTQTFDDLGQRVATEYVQEYGGIVGDQWRVYGPLDVLDLSFPGVLRIDGLQWQEFMREAHELKDAEERQLRSLYNDIGKALRVSSTD
jgi:hypothetical protein